MSQSTSYCSIDLTDQDPVPPDDYSYVISIAANKYEVSARNMREGTLSRIVEALDSRQSRSTQVPLGQQAGGLLVLDATSERVCIELRSRQDNGDDHIAARVILTDEEVKALHDEARRAADAYDE